VPGVRWTSPRTGRKAAGRVSPRDGLVKGDGLMGLREVVVERLTTLVGGPVRVMNTLVDHDERYVIEVELPGGRPAVAKCVVDPDRADVEALALEAAAGAGVPVPRLVARDRGAPTVLVLERVGGAWLAPDRPARGWVATGAALRRLHGVAVPGLPPFAGREGWAAGLRELADHWGPRARAAGLDRRVVDAGRGAADRLMRSGPAEPRIVTLHGDCVPIHVRLDGDDRVVSLLDLGDACRGDPAWDLAVLTMRAPDRLPAVLDGYGTDSDLRAWTARAWPVYRALRLVAEVGWLADHRFDPAEAVREATAAVRVLP
jgi:aminoglycoside phosphotransferase (APT) family kinase protein